MSALRERPRQLARVVRFVAPMLRAGPRGRVTTADLIERRAKQQPERVFVRFEDRSLSYGDYNAAANRVAHWALAHGLRHGDVVALVMENRPEYLVVWAGLAKIGVTCALVNTNLAGRGLAHALETAGAEVVILGAECVPAWASLSSEARSRVETFVSRDPAKGAVSRPPGAADFDEVTLGFSPHDPGRHVRAELRGGDDLFYIYTSGTTGLPKAARFSHARFMGGGAHHLLSGFGRDDVLYCALPLYHTVGGVICVNAVLRAGATLALARKFSASRFWKEIAETEATSFQYVGELCRYLLNQPASSHERQHRLRYCVGNGLRPELWPRFQERFAIPRIVEFYGATESNVVMMNLANKSGSVGKLAPGTKARLIRYDVESETHVRDARGRCIEVGIGEPGELIARIAEGSSLAGRFEGYTSAEASERKILRDVFERGDAWFRTGDLLRRDGEGYFYFVDRIGDTFRWKGENVSTEEVAQAMGAFPGVELCAVYGVEVPGGDGRAGMAAVVLADPAGFDGKALYEHVSQALPGYARPAFVRIQAEPDLTGTFKLRKVDLQRQGFDPSASKDPIYFRDDVARAYAPLTAEAHARIQSGELRF